MAKSYENAYGMYCDGDAVYYQGRGREWSTDVRSDLEQFGPYLKRYQPARELVTQAQEYAAQAYSRARFCAGIRETDYDC